MSDKSLSAVLEAESNTEETKSFIKQVRRRTRRKFTPEEKIRIVLEGFRHEVSIRDLCRREGIRPNVYYAWLRDFMEAGKERLARDTVRDATRAEVDGVKRENERLKQLVADLSLKVYVLKKSEIPGLE
jgi:transposase|tara:strand:- start:587 stop:973 length:387 start_codon:yes stop_codon:yes gene_type:complete